mgnify:CR=1 FL=1
MDISSLMYYEQQMAINATSLVSGVQSTASKTGSVSGTDAVSGTGAADSFESTLAAALNTPVTSEYTASGTLTADAVSGTQTTGAASQTASEASASAGTQSTSDAAQGTSQASGSSGSGGSSSSDSDTTTEMIRQPDGSIYLKTTTTNSDGTSTVTLTKIADGGAGSMENILGVNANDKLSSILNNGQNSSGTSSAAGAVSSSNS